MSHKRQLVHALQHIVRQRDRRRWIDRKILRGHARSGFVSPLDHAPATFSVSARDERIDLALEFSRRLEQSWT